MVFSYGWKENGFHTRSIPLLTDHSDSEPPELVSAQIIAHSGKVHSQGSNAWPWNAKWQAPQAKNFRCSCALVVTFHVLKGYPKALLWCNMLVYGIQFQGITVFLNNVDRWQLDSWCPIVPVVGFVCFLSEKYSEHAMKTGSSFWLFCASLNNFPTPGRSFP